MAQPPNADPRSDLPPKIAFVAALGLLAFLYGFVTSHYEWFPHAFLSQALSEGEQVGKPRSAAFPLHHVHLARHELQGARSHAGGPAPGTTLITTYWSDRGDLPGLRLIDAAGNTLHHWDANPARIWPESPHQDGMRGMLNVPNNYVHGSYLFENGDVLFSVEYLGLCRLDATGAVVWRLDRRTHHSVTRDEDGNFWVCAIDWIETEQQRQGRFPGLDLPIAEDRALLVSPEGKVLEELSVLEALYASPYKDLIWRVGPRRAFDVLHTNDVEPLPSALAAAYPTLAAGDLVMSLCNIDLVMVVDRQTRAVKWAVESPHLSQHDPDFIGDGWISVFDNRTDGTEDGRALGGSRMLAFRPHTGEMRQLYPVPGDPAPAPRFYTKQGGKAQQLPGGHWLLTEAQAGRVFEVDAGGRTVWEWVNPRRADGKTVSEVLEGCRYPIAPEAPSRW